MFKIAVARRGWPLLRVLVILLAFHVQAVAVDSQIPAPLELQYHLRLARPSTHIMEVEIQAGKVAEPALNFVMPAWAPGRYAIYDFAKNVQEFSAAGSEGQALPWT